MSQENMEKMRRMLDAWDSGDLTEWADGLHEDITWVPLAENTQTEPIHGVEATLAFVADWIEPWDEYTVELLRFIDVDDMVVMSTRQSGKHPTGAEISMEMHAVATVRDGKLVEMRWFMSEAEALEAAGLSTQ
jgi:ketosteroid isomerase-like protein